MHPKFSPLVNVGSYYIVEDSNAEEVCDRPTWESLKGGPLQAIYEFLRECNGDFTVATNWCDFFGINSTFNTYGYLKRIK